jgi:hypothetical protein
MKNGCEKRSRPNLPNFGIAADSYPGAARKFSLSGVPLAGTSAQLFCTAHENGLNQKNFETPN